ncbi:adenosine deaminase, tRNA-specific 3 [Phytophthora boehmeriae]|uniref:Adenosine deaminase, tRNA-specific 3 n=1 Tax=Phytophthora boehmeriae TaxID=109152 RepID=A0A8T1WX84_9STRA|nr:adenosine deaminase, tRNA-specific 3 [Phytophthora boehmeriae]
MSRDPVEIVASEAFDPAALEAQQCFLSLEFPARHGSKVMSHLATNFQPLSDLGFGHLKRLKKHSSLPKTLVALIRPEPIENGEIPALPEQIQSLETLFDAKITTAEALKCAPRTRELFEKHTKKWPLIFHSSVEEAATLPPIEEHEKQQMKKHLETAEQCGTRLQELKCASGVVVVDPRVDEVVATSHVTEEQESKYRFRTIYHPVMVAVDAVAERDRRREAAAVEETARKKQKRGDSSVEQDVETEEGDGEDKQNQSYLCTGYDVYLDYEPCAMCAMALVHSRARRVVFDRSNPSDGALQSSFQLHTIKSLNHHYRVFQLAISSEQDVVEAVTTSKGEK